MGRIRTIKPELPQSESLGRVSREARLCFVLLFTLADDAGRLRGNSRMLASLLYPYDIDAPQLIDGWLKELQNQNCIVRYHIERKSYIGICNWLEHQKINRPSKSKIPQFTEASLNLHEDSLNALEASREDQGSRIKEGIKDQGSKRAKNARTAQAPDLPDWLPLDAWNAFVEMRNRVHAPLTVHAKSLVIGKLEKFRLDGQDAVAALNQSTMNSYRGVFPVHAEGKDNGSRYKTAKDRQRETDQQAIELIRQQDTAGKTI